MTRTIRKTVEVMVFPFLMLFIAVISILEYVFNKVDGNDEDDI